LSVIGAVEITQTQGDRLHGFIVGCVGLGKGLNRLPFEIRQRDVEPVGCKSTIERDVRRVVNVRRAIVAVDTIHSPFCSACDLFLRKL
jgi:hypothetical protein